jgi:hypothetical protein
MADPSSDEWIRYYAEAAQRRRVNGWADPLRQQVLWYRTRRRVLIAGISGLFGVILTLFVFFTR